MMRLLAFGAALAAGCLRVNQVRLCSRYDFAETGLYTVELTARGRRWAGMPPLRPFRLPEAPVGVMRSFRRSEATWRPLPTKLLYELRTAPLFDPISAHDIVTNGVIGVMPDELIEAANAELRKER